MTGVAEASTGPALEVPVYPEEVPTGLGEEGRDKPCPYSFAYAAIFNPEGVFSG